MSETTEELTQSPTITVFGTPGLTDEDWAILEEKVPQSEVKSYEGRGGKEMRYTSVEFVEGRLEKVDRNYSKVVVLSEKGVTVHYTVKGVTRGGAFDYDEGGKFGTPATNAEARAARRAGRNFHVARELWEDAVGEDSSPRQEKARSREGSSSRDRSNGNSGGGYGSGGKKPATPAQMKMLVDILSVPEDLAKRLNAFATKDDDEVWHSEVSDTISALKKAKDANPEGYDRNSARLIETALKKTARKTYQQWLRDTEEDDDED